MIQCVHSGEHVNLQIYKSTNVQMYKSIDLQMYKNTHLQIYNEIFFKTFDHNSIRDQQQQRR